MPASTGWGGAEISAYRGTLPSSCRPSRLVRRKGQDVLLEAWPRVLAELPSARLVVVGGGPTLRRLRRMSRSRRLSRSVTFVPAVSWQAMPAVYAMANVFALPVRERLWGLETEAFGIVFQEAAASGLTVLAGRCGGVPEAADPRVTTWVDGRNSAEVARGLLQCLDRSGATLRGGHPASGTQQEEEMPP